MLHLKLWQTFIAGLYVLCWGTETDKNDEGKLPEDNIVQKSSIVPKNS